MNLDHIQNASVPIPPNTIYTYSDGSANTYCISSTSIQYFPVTTQWSSSGYYNGGEATKITLNHEQFEKLKLVLEQAIANKQDHINKRTKMSAMLSLRTQNISYILEAHSPSKTAIDLILNQWLTS